ncbi:MAG: hypothetical protein UY05_C0017G0002 [Candidatus Peregrinibacteria bacterium GW2011_GWA2_47_7]|nr:MAG: hypothetical protein UY05_C0017G0002 [Candidatus Peregrinibacteria bacterium GW2011_GWA2_47_7]
MKIPRLYDNLSPHLKENKVLLIYGPRQVGKTTLLLDYLNRSSLKYKIDSGDNIATHAVMGSQDIKAIQEYASGYDLIAIDEAQRIPHIGQGLKILVDSVPGIKVIATGSSSFDLAGQVGEPLTGRKISLMLFPVSQLECKNIYNTYELKEKRNDFLVFGSYPEVVTSETRQEKIQLLEELMNAYLLKDILELERVKNSKLLLDLLRLLAFQIGHEVSLNELARQLGIDAKTVARYIDLFEKSFVLYNLRGFSRNLRKEVTKKSKFYFYDLGLRNAVIANFNDLPVRNDVGVLWENFLFMERIKKRSYANIIANAYFWRTWDKKEIDLIEEREGRLFGYEFKWNEAIKVHPPADWQSAYPDAEYHVITKDNYLEFIA